MIMRLSKAPSVEALSRAGVVLFFPGSTPCLSAPLGQRLQRTTFDAALRVLRVRCATLVVSTTTNKSSSQHPARFQLMAHGLPLATLVACPNTVSCWRCISRWRRRSSGAAAPTKKSSRHHQKHHDHKQTHECSSLENESSVGSAGGLAPIRAQPLALAVASGLGC